MHGSGHGRTTMNMVACMQVVADVQETADVLQEDDSPFVSPHQD